MQDVSHGGTMGEIQHDVTRFTEGDIHLFKEGTHYRLYEKLGSHIMQVGGLQGTCFAVWAPNAAAVSVVGDWNGWNPRTHQLALRPDDSGIWEGFIPGVGKGSRYKYHIVSRYGDYEAEKGDPFALCWEQAPETASLVWDTSYAWGDGEWLKNRHSISSVISSPIPAKSSSSWEESSGNGRNGTTKKASIGISSNLHSIRGYRSGYGI